MRADYDKTIGLVRFALWVTKAKDTLRMCTRYYFLLSHCKNCYTNAPRFCVYTTFPSNVDITGC